MKLNHIRAVLLLLIAAAAPVRAQTLEDHVRQGNLALRDGRWQDAVISFSRAVELEPKSASAHAGKVRSLLRLSRTADAARALQAAVSAAPDSPAVHEAAGELRLRQGRFDAALLEFRRALATDPMFAPAWWGMARVHAAMSMRETARKEALQALALVPDDPDLLLTWAQLQKTSKLALPALERYLAIRPLNDSQRQWIGNQIALLNALQDRKTFVLASRYEPSEVPLLPLAGGSGRLGGWAIEVSINGGGARPFLLDTGATGLLLLDRQFALESGIERLAGSRINGVGDTRGMDAYLGLAARLQIGSVQLNDCVVQVGDHLVPGEYAGVLGADVLAKFRIALDFPHRLLRLTPFATPDGVPPDDGEFHDREVPADETEFTPVYRVGHLLLAPAAVNEGAAALFAIDSGSGLNVLSTDLARRFGALEPLDVQLRGISGALSDAYLARNVALQIAGFRQWNRLIVATGFADVSRGLGAELGGVLGRPLLDSFSLTLDYRNGLVRFDYQGRGLL